MRIEEEEEKGENRGRVELRMCRTYKDRGGGGLKKRRTEEEVEEEEEEDWGGDG